MPPGVVWVSTFFTGGAGAGGCTRCRFYGCCPESVLRSSGALLAWAGAVQSLHETGAGSVNVQFKLFMPSGIDAGVFLFD